MAGRILQPRLGQAEAPLCPSGWWIGSFRRHSYVSRVLAGRNLKIQCGHDDGGAFTLDIERTRALRQGTYK
jgi:hypothetical protein